MADALSKFPINGYQENTQKSAYKKENISDINYMEEWTEYNLSITLK